MPKHNVYRGAGFYDAEYIADLSANTDHFMSQRDINLPKDKHPVVTQSENPDLEK